MAVRSYVAVLFGDDRTAVSLWHIVKWWSTPCFLSDWLQYNFQAGHKTLSCLPIESVHIFGWKTVRVLIFHSDFSYKTMASEKWMRQLYFVAAAMMIITRCGFLLKSIHLEIHELWPQYTRSLFPNMEESRSFVVFCWNQSLLKTIKSGLAGMKKACETIEFLTHSPVINLFTRHAVII